jgi:isoleucyl-tRNA synthetase
MVLYASRNMQLCLFDDVAYKNIVVNELDSWTRNGMKMSKSKGNALLIHLNYSPNMVLMLHDGILVTTSPPWRPTLFDEEGIVEVQRKFFGTLVLIHTHSSHLYANIDGWKFEEDMIAYDHRPEIDRWIISKLNSLVEEYEKLMDDYDLTKAARAVSDFTIDQLSNWYVRRCRRRFWKSEINENKLSAYQTLYECLETILKLTSPFSPFVAEELFQNLNGVTKKESNESIHLVSYPTINYRVEELETKMDIAQRVVYLTRSMRAKSNLKVRQPLQKIIVAVDKERRDAVNYMKDVILDEVNIKELEALEDDASIVSKSAKANFKAIGPKYGKLVKQLAAKIVQLTKEEISEIETNGKLAIEVNGENIELNLEDVEIISTEIEGWVVESEEGSYGCY